MSALGTYDIKTGYPVVLVDVNETEPKEPNNLDNTERKPLRLYKSVDMDNLLKHNFPMRDYVLDPILTLGSLNMLYSWRGVGKTHVALGMAYASASGGTFLNWSVHKPFRTLYIDGEMPGEAIQSRLKSIINSSDKAPKKDYLKFITIDLEGGIMPDLATREGHAQIAEACEQAELIIVDNLSCLVRGSGKENEANSWTEAQEWGLSLRSKGKCILMVHHAGKDGAQRGTSKREDLLDVSISLKRPSDYEADQGARFEVRLEKARHITVTAAQPFEAWLSAKSTSYNRLIFLISSYSFLGRFQPSEANSTPYRLVPPTYAPPRKGDPPQYLTTETGQVRLDSPQSFALKPSVQPI